MTGCLGHKLMIVTDRGIGIINCIRKTHLLTNRQGFFSGILQTYEKKSRRIVDVTLKKIRK